MWIFIGMLIIAVVLLLMLLQAQKNTLELTSSQRNILLINNAKDDMDASICDKIRGTTEEQGPHRPEGYTGIDVFANGTPAMTESEAKKWCKESVQWRIDHQSELQK